MIPDTLYATLTPIERVRAAVSAAVREDGNELERLKRTTAKFTYQMTAPAYSEAMQALSTITLLVEHNMRGCAIDLLLADRADKDRLAMDYAITGLLEDLEALRRLASRLGIEPEELEKFGPPRHHYVQTILDVADAWEINEENVEKLVAGYLGFFSEGLLDA